MTDQTPSSGSPKRARSRSTSAGDVDILSFALTLEYLESDFYRVKGTQVGLNGSAKSLAAEFGAQEAEHVSALTAST